MVFRHISKDLKERALWLIAHEYAPDDICKFFDISQRSIARWRHNDHVHGSVIPPPNPMQSRPCLLNADMMHDLYMLLEEAPEMYLSEIQDWMALTHISEKVQSSRGIMDLGLVVQALLSIKRPFNSE